MKNKIRSVTSGLNLKLASIDMNFSFWDSSGPQNIEYQRQFQYFEMEKLNFYIYFFILKMLLKYGFYKYIVYFFSEWTSEQFNISLNIFVITFGWVQQQSNSKPTQKWWQKCSKKCSTDQRLIWKRNTTYEIGTLVEKKIKWAAF